VICLLIEFLDELGFGVGEVALPLLRDDLHLAYTQIGLLLSLPGQSASLMAIGTVTTPIAKFFPLAIGFLANQFRLESAMWILILGPLALLIGLPRNDANNSPIL
jgi:hypothetical protein